MIISRVNGVRSRLGRDGVARTSVGDAWIDLLQQRFPHLRKANLRLFGGAGAYSQTEPIFSDMRVIDELLAPTLRRVIFRRQRAGPASIGDDRPGDQCAVESGQVKAADVQHERMGAVGRKRRWI
ncbi:MAG: hypothetical protein ACM3VX_07025 [Bacteroidota bacterium]